MNLVNPPESAVIAMLSYIYSLLITVISEQALPTYTFIHNHLRERILLRCLLKVL